MIFTKPTSTKSLDDIESYKERNFYYKIFAGYLFNELIPGYQVRKEQFFDLLQFKIKKGLQFYGPKNANDTKTMADLRSMQIADINVTFDFHNAQFDPKNNDRGEFADILIRSDEGFISIEAKYLSDWDFDEDVVENQNRILKSEYHLNNCILQILLIINSKWENVVSMQKSKGSNYIKLIDRKDEIQKPLLVMTWDEINAIIHDEHVNEYMANQLKRVIKPKVFPPLI